LDRTALEKKKKEAPKKKKKLFSTRKGGKIRPHGAYVKN